MIDYFGKCEIGKVRKSNQDSIIMLTKDDMGIFVVADGMGGHSYGEKASGLIIEKVTEWWNRLEPQIYGCDFRKMMSAIRQTVNEANASIFEQYNQEAVCGSTIVLLFIYKNHYGILYAGDSRCYSYYKRRMKQLTVDDVWENQIYISNRERMDVSHPNRGKLVNAIGIQREVQCKIETDEYMEGMTFLLCSDGLYKMCSEKDMGRSLHKCRKKGKLAEACEGMLSKVYKNGAEDNVSLILVQGMEK